MIDMMKVADHLDYCNPAEVSGLDPQCAVILQRNCWRKDTRNEDSYGVRENGKIAL
jgi:hypothetical protein